MGIGDVFNFFIRSKKNKLKNGTHHLNYKNGNFMLIGKVEKGDKEGVWKLFYENGNLKSRGAYHKGLKEGYWEYFYENAKGYQLDQYQQDFYQSY